MNIPNMTKSFLALAILTCAHGSGTLRVRVHIAEGHFGDDAPLPEGWIARLPAGWTTGISRTKNKPYYKPPQGKTTWTRPTEYWNERMKVSTHKRPPFEIQPRRNWTIAKLRNEIQTLCHLEKFNIGLWSGGTIDKPIDDMVTEWRTCDYYIPYDYADLANVYFSVFVLNNVKVNSDSDEVTAPQLGRNVSHAVRKSRSMAMPMYRADTDQVVYPVSQSRLFAMDRAKKNTERVVNPTILQQPDSVDTEKQPDSVDTEKQLESVDSSPE